jgi:diguanylate cyclase (GGDEF)-like protein
VHHQDGRVAGAVIVFRDMSAERALSLKMEHVTHYDVLTDLPNRGLFRDRLTQAIVLARRQGTRVAVLFLDLDRFKHITDSLGEAMGDALLQSVSARLLACVRGSDTVSRRDGDEFVVLLSPLQEADHAAIVADEMIGAIAAPHKIADHVLHVTGSIGISLYPDDADEADRLISAADEAMCHAKENGRDNCQFFTSQMNAPRLARRSLESSLGDALHRKEFALHYQPKVDLATSRMTAVEALLRWQHPARGLVAPGEFVPMAEECGLILPIGRWVLREACRQARAWQDAGLRPMSIAVNVSAIEFRAASFLAHVSDVLHETGLEARYLELEVTESVLMADAESTIASLFA